MIQAQKEKKDDHLPVIGAHAHLGDILYPGCWSCSRAVNRPVEDGAKITGSIDMDEKLTEERFRKYDSKSTSSTAPKLMTMSAQSHEKLQTGKLTQQSPLNHADDIK